MAHNIIGLDYGEDSIKYVKISPNRSKLEILESIEIAYDNENTLEKLKSKNDDFWVYGLKDINVYKKNFNLPFKNKDKINKVLPFQLEKKLLFKLNTAHFDTFFDINKKDKSTRLYNYLVKKEEFEPFFDEIKNHPIKLRAVLPDTMAYRYLFHLTEKEKAFFIDIGAKKTRFLYFENNQIIVDRTILIGGKNIDEEIAKVFDVELDRAKDAKEKVSKIYVENDLNQEKEKSKLVIEKIIKENIDKILESLKLELKRNKISENCSFYLLGKMSKISNINSYVKDRLNIDFEKNTAWIDPTFATAIGYALRETPFVRDYRLNLLKGKYELKTSSKGEYSGLVLRVAIFLLILIALFFTKKTIQYKYLKKRVTKMENNTIDLSNKLIKDDFSNPVELLSIISDSRKDEQKKMIPNKTSFDHLEKISKILLDEKIKVDVKKMQISNKQIVMDTELDSIDLIDKIVSGLNKNKCYKEIKKGRSKTINKSDRVRVKFTINKMDC